MTVERYGLARERVGFVLLRAVMGLIFVTHGLARLYYGSVPDFGAFVDASGLPFGVLLAWTITLGEITSGSLLAAGVAVRWCVTFHAVVIGSGVVLVHVPQGWFTVGHGSGGMEYSMLILAVLAYIFIRKDQPTLFGWK